MLRVALVNPPFPQIVLRDNYCSHTSKANYVWAPADLLYISGSLKEKDISFKVYDFVASPSNNPHELVKSQDPTHVICLTGAVSFREDMEFCLKLHQGAGVKVIVCGNIPAFEPERFLREFPFVDAIFHNFFDKKIADYLLDRKHISPSITYRSNEQIIFGRINYLQKQEPVEAAVPAIEQFPVANYSTPLSLRKPLATSITSFGCPYSCSFCVASELSLNHREISNIRSELAYFESVGIKEIFFMDSTFNSSARRLEELCSLMKEFDFTWSCNIHAKTITRDQLAMLRSAGCHTIQIGVESFTETSLKKHAPTKDIEVTRNAFKDARALGLRTLGYFILGLPDEDEADVQKTIKFAIDLNPTFASFSSLAADYGTPLYRQLKHAEVKNDRLRSYDNSGKPEPLNIKLTAAQRERLIRRAYFQFYFRPCFIFRALLNFRQLSSYLSNGLVVLKKVLISGN